MGLESFLYDAFMCSSLKYESAVADCRSAVAWFEHDHDDLIQDLTNRISLATNLNLESGEQLQVSNCKLLCRVYALVDLQQMGSVGTMNVITTTSMRKIP